jgi:hypothetical protein
MASGNEMRVGDAEREAAAAELREHFASGRLTQEELDERLDRVLGAKTRADLAAVFTDLPSGRGWAGAGAPGGQSGLGGQPWSSGSNGPFGPNGPFGQGGPFGPGGPFGARGSFGPCGPFGQGGPFGPAGQARWRATSGAVISTIIMSMILSVAMFVMLMVGILGIFGLGVARPIGILLVVLSFVLRRIFGIRRRGQGPRRRRW